MGSGAVCVRPETLLSWQRDGSGSPDEQLRPTWKGPTCRIHCASGSHHSSHYTRAISHLQLRHRQGNQPGAQEVSSVQAAASPRLLLTLSAAETGSSFLLPTFQKAGLEGGLLSSSPPERWSSAWQRQAAPKGWGW